MKDSQKQVQSARPVHILSKERRWRRVELRLRLELGTRCRTIMAPRLPTAFKDPRSDAAVCADSPASSAQAMANVPGRPAGAWRAGLRTAPLGDQVRQNPILSNRAEVSLSVGPELAALGVVRIVAPCGNLVSDDYGIVYITVFRTRVSGSAANLDCS